MISGKDERDSGNDIASLPAHSREHIHFAEEIPHTVNATPEPLATLSSSVNLGDILGATSTHRASNQLVETTTERGEAEFNINYADGLQEQSIVDDDDVKLNDFQLYPTEDSTIPTTTEATIVAPSTFNSTSLEDFEKSLENFVIGTSTESTTSDVMIEHTTTVAYNFSKKPEDNSTMEAVDNAESFHIPETDPANAEKRDQGNEQLAQERDDTGGGADIIGDEGVQLDSNDISQFII